MIFTPGLVLVAAVIFAVSRMRRGPVRMAATKFWTLVQTQDRPVVLLTTRGSFRPKLCYAFPYNGIVFWTEARRPSAPEGVRVVDPGSGFWV